MTSNTFENTELFLEEYKKNAVLIKVQILADFYGNIVHFGDVECNIQINNQEILEETKGTSISESIRRRIYSDSIKICKSIKLEGMATIEYLVTQDEQYFFLKINTGLQDEHTLAEMITGIDIVKEQIKIYEGDYLSFGQDNLLFNGYAMQCRVLANISETDTALDYVRVENIHIPGGYGVRVDTACGIGDRLSSTDDPLICKILSCGKDQNEGYSIMRRSIEELNIHGVHTNRDTLIKFLDTKTL